MGSENKYRVTNKATPLNMYSTKINDEHKHTHKNKHLIKHISQTTQTSINKDILGNQIRGKSHHRAESIRNCHESQIVFC